MSENSGIAGAIAAVTLAFFALLPALLVVLLFLFLLVYTIVRAFGPADAHASAVTVYIGLVLIVTTLVALLAGGSALIGRSMGPRKRREDLD